MSLSPGGRPTSMSYTPQGVAGELSASNTRSYRAEVLGVPADVAALAGTRLVEPGARTDAKLLALLAARVSDLQSK